MNDQNLDSGSEGQAQAPVAGAEPKKKKAPPRQADLFSTAKTIAQKLEPFSYEEKLQTLAFVRSGIESQQKAAQAEKLKAEKPFQPHFSEPAPHAGLEAAAEVSPT